MGEQDMSIGKNMKKKKERYMCNCDCREIVLIPLKLLFYSLSYTYTHTHTHTHSLCSYAYSQSVFFPFSLSYCMHSLFFSSILNLEFIQWWISCASSAFSKVKKFLSFNDVIHDSFSTPNICIKTSFYTLMLELPGSQPQNKNSLKFFQLYPYFFSD